jgi:YidC/Oxa1 family membrane protein insertase
MDKRNFVFIITMLVAFFLINQWYGPASQKDLADAKSLASSFVASEEPSQLSLDAMKLSQVEVVQSADPNQILGKGYRFDHYLVTFMSKDPAKTIGVKKGGQVVPMDLIFQSDDGFSLYSSDVESPLQCAYMPQFKEISAVLLPVASSDQGLQRAQIYNQKMTLKGSSAVDSIVVVMNQGAWLPVGYYVAKNKQLHLFTEFEEIRDILAFQSPYPQDMTAKEQFYVLENGYQQLVFSTLGGSLAEINLPFKSQKDDQSIIYPIKSDAIIQKKFPFEARFPLVDAIRLGADRQLVNAKSSIGGYLPLLRRDIKGSDGKNKQDFQSRFYAMNLVAENKSLSQKPFKMTRMEADSITFELKDQDKQITKTYRFLPQDQAPYTVVAEVVVKGNLDGLHVTTGIPEVELIGDTFSPMLQYAQGKKDKVIVEKAKLPKSSEVVDEDEIAYVVNSNGYFGLFLGSLTRPAPGFAASMVPGNLVPTRLSVIDTAYEKYPQAKFPGYEMMLSLDDRMGQVMKDGSRKYTLAFYAGPIEEKLLKKVDQALKAQYIDVKFSEAQTYYGWFSFISEPFAKFLFLLMQIFYSFTHSWGLAIILLTVALRVMLYPLNEWASKSNSKMQELAPQLKVMQEKYKKDPQRYQMEMLKFYRENKINPFSSFLPILIQIPFMIGMFDLLKSTFQLRGAAFIPGWIDNLAAPDVLFSWSYPLPYFGNSFHLLPILVGLAMFWQSRMSMPKVPEGQLTDQQRQQKTISTVFMLLLPVMFYHFASGLNIYWLFSTLLGIAQQSWSKKRLKKT